MVCRRYYILQRVAKICCRIEFCWGRSWPLGKEELHLFLSATCAHGWWCVRGFFLLFRLSDILKQLSIRLELVGNGLCLSSLTAKPLNGIASMFNNISRSQIFRNTFISKRTKLIICSTIFWRIQRIIGLTLNGKLLVTYNQLEPKLDQIRGSHYSRNRLRASRQDHEW